VIEFVRCGAAFKGGSWNQYGLAIGQQAGAGVAGTRASARCGHRRLRGRHNGQKDRDRDLYEHNQNGDDDAGVVVIGSVWPRL
jgi:hypothetical protein